MVDNGARGCGVQSQLCHAEPSGECGEWRDRGVEQLGFYQMKLNALGNLGKGEVSRSIVSYYVDQHLGALTLWGKVRGRHGFVLARALFIGYMMTLEEA